MGQETTADIIQEVMRSRSARIQKVGYEGYHKDIIMEDLREKSAYDRCLLLDLTDADLLEVLEERKLEKIETCLLILSKKPKWRDTGDKIPLSDPYTWQTVGVGYSYRTLKIKLATQQIDRYVLDILHSFLTDENQVMYDQ